MFRYINAFPPKKLACGLRHKMRLSFRLSLAASLFICLLLLLIRFRLNEAPLAWRTKETTLEELRDDDIQKEVASEPLPLPYLPAATSSAQPEPTPSSTSAPEKVIVMARLESEQTDWVAEELSEYDRSLPSTDPVHMFTFLVGTALFTRWTTPARNYTCL